MSSKADKMRQQAAAKKIEDKTFGMKNKNKSKQVQQQIAQMKKTAGVGDDKRNAAETKKEAANAAIESVLFKEAVTKKDLAKRALEKAAAKAAKEKEKAKEPDKRDIYTDTRDEKAMKEEDDMSTWDTDKLNEVVESKKKGQGQRVPTDIICKHFLDAVEKRTYGWFWECPNGGDKCQYRHALPEGYVLKRDKVDDFVDNTPKLEDIIEEKRKALTTRTPVTFERLQEWLAKKKAAQAAAEEEELDAARKQYAKGKTAGVTGRMLFTIDASLFVDDEKAGAFEKYVRDDSDDDEEGGNGGGGGDGSSGGAAASSAASGSCATAAAAAAAPPGKPSEAASGGAYAQNYDASGGGGSGGGGSSAPVDLTDLENVDESLFLDDDLPDDDEIAELE